VDESAHLIASAQGIQGAVNIVIKCDKLADDKLCHNRKLADDKLCHNRLVSVGLFSDMPFPLCEREKFITRQPPIGGKDDYDSQNSWISDGQCS